MRSLFTSAVLAFAAVALTPAASRAADAGSSGNTLPACVEVRAESRYIPFGYNHVVFLKNGCSKAATCTVSTDVNPEPRSVDVAPQALVEVTTFVASPSQVFTPRVSCVLR